MTKYQVRANIATIGSLALGEPEEYEVIAESKSMRQADENAQNVFESYSKARGNEVYNYTSIDVVDAKHGDLIQRYQFDTNYILRSVVEKTMDEIIDSNAQPITIFNTTYPASTVLKHTDPLTYEEAINLLATQAKQVII
jgi:hypothetical protein